MKKAIIIAVLLTILIIVGNILRLKNISSKQNINVMNSLSSANSKMLEDDTETKNDSDTNEFHNIEIDEKDIVMDASVTACLSKNISKSEVRNELSDYIIIGTVSAIDGGSNYNSKQNIYTFVTTLGEIDVLKVIKGNIDKEKIPFLRLGGTINLEEYEKGLIEDRLGNVRVPDEISKLSPEEKKTKYIKQKFIDDIDISAGTTYLMYLTYNQDYDRYNVLFMQHGLNEVQFEDNNSMKLNDINNSNIDEIMIKDNVTEEYIRVSDYIGDISE